MTTSPFSGYREYRLTMHGRRRLSSRRCRHRPGHLACRISRRRTAFSMSPAEVRRMALSTRTCSILTKANSRSTVHRPAYLDYIGIKTFDAERQGHRRAPIPRAVHRGRVHAERAGHSVPVAQSSTRCSKPAALARVTATTAATWCSSSRRIRAMSCSASRPTSCSTWRCRWSMQERRQVRLFLRPDDYRRFISCLVYLPRDRYSTEVRTAIERVLMQAFGGESIDFTARVSESVLARLHFVVRLPKGRALPDIDVEELEKRVPRRRVRGTTSSVDALVDAYGEEKARAPVQGLRRRLPRVVQRGLRCARGGRPTSVTWMSCSTAGDMTMSLYESFGARRRTRGSRCSARRSGLAVDCVAHVAADGCRCRRGAAVHACSARDGMTVWLHDFGFTYPEPPGRTAG